MPKDGYDAITISDALSNKISDFVEQSGGLIPNKTAAISQAWQLFESLSLEYKNPVPVKIGNKLIGHDQPVYIIAEIGINHNGSIELAKQLIDLAVQSGCDAVKFQKRTVDLVYTPEELAKPRESPFGTTNGDLKRGLEFGEEQYKEIDRYCKEKGITWFASPWDIPSVDFLEKFNVPCYKIASASLTDKDLLIKIKSTGKPIILSTGMSTMEEINRAVKLLGEDNLIILHCTSTYPTDPKEHNLSTIKTFRKYFNCPIGYSGHEVEVTPTIAATALGACVVERHITLDRAMYGSDQAASLERKGIEMVCSAARYMPIYLGRPNKIVFDSEKPIIDKLRKVKTL
ncbi:MAG: N-acetylneuraminate synthase family protein [Candidatus Pacearchaeota archaeon]|jgi:N-acetylneuraminate synthase